MTPHTHRRFECEHGTVVAQCRCIGPHEVVRVGCPPECPFAAPPSGPRWAEHRPVTGRVIVLSTRTYSPHLVLPIVEVHGRRLVAKGVAAQPGAGYNQADVRLDNGDRHVLRLNLNTPYVHAGDDVRVEVELPRQVVSPRRVGGW
jgi:hypothetical protein